MAEANVMLPVSQSKESMCNSISPESSSLLYLLREHEVSKTKLLGLREKIGFPGQREKFHFFSKVFLGT